MSLQETLHYVGEFKDLIPNGWEFRKLYANNYRAYALSVKDQCGDVMIWQKDRYFVFPQLHEESSAALMRFLFNGVEFKPYSGAAQEKLKFTGLAPIELVYDSHTNEFEIAAKEYRWKPLPDHQRPYVLSSEFAELVMKWYDDKLFEFSA